MTTCVELWDIEILPDSQVDEYGHVVMERLQCIVQQIKCFTRLYWETSQVEKVKECVNGPDHPRGVQVILELGANDYTENDAAYEVILISSHSGQAGDAAGENAYVMVWYEAFTASIDLIHTISQNEP